MWLCIRLYTSDQNGQKREIEIVGVPPSRVPERHAAGVAPLDPYHTDRGVEAIDANTAYLVVKNINTGCVYTISDRSFRLIGYGP